ncbi:tyrosine-type recombinase/integrase [Geodermatophilus saharensis]|uniref:tyrosine-type recombinase/integrase n=1 Tax=Geodermatophilus saharensis TaxID=1137994 RepID=UPI0015958EF0|nr:site-specific integrase [Geodermatophilus saharensis]
MTQPSRSTPPRSAPLSLDVALTAVLASWHSEGLHSEQTVARVGETAARFTARLQASGVATFADVTPADAAGFIDARTRAGASPELATRHARRTAVRMLYRTLRALGQPVGDPTLDLRLPPRGLLAARPLTDDEVMLCRATAQLGWPTAARLRAVVWALGESGAVTSEITTLTVADLDDPAAPTTVRLPGTARHDPRSGDLSPWGARLLARHAADLTSRGATPATPLAYAGAAPRGGAKAQAAACNAIRTVLDRAGFGDDADVRPASLRNWAGRRLYDAGAPLEQVARALGHRSLDACAEDIALTWREDTR